VSVGNFKQINTMNKLYNYLIFAITIGLFSCADLLISEKDVFQKKIPLYSFYEGISSSMITNSGLIVQVNKSLTNGDSVNCEVFAKSDNQIAKIDFKGNVIWEKSIKDINIANLIKGDNGNFYEFINSFPSKLKMFDSTFTLINERELSVKNSINNNVYIDKIAYWKEDKFIGYGQFSTGKKVNGKIIFKQFFCQISMQNGISKYFEDDTELIDSQQSKYFVSPDGYLIGYYIPNQYLPTNIPIAIRKYDLNNFGILAQKDTILNDQINTYYNSFSNDNIYAIAIGGGSTMKPNKLYKIDSNLKIYAMEIGNSNRLEFVKNIADKILLTKYENGKTTIYLINDNFKAEIVKDISNNYDQLLVKNNKNISEVFSFGMINYGKKPKIEYRKFEDSDNTTIKSLYQSEYSRNCYRWTD
jgi:hypothetical protein